MAPRRMESRGQYQQSNAKLLIELYEGKNPQTIPSTPHSSSLKRPLPPQKKEKSPIRQSLSKVIKIFRKTTSTRIQGPEISTLQSTPSGSRLFGSLLWLSMDECSGLPAWRSCTAALERGALRITYSANNNVQSLSIQLQQCSDVRSLTSLEAVAPLPTTEHGVEPKVFELVFGEDSEKFAASSIRDRANWVSSVWDSILLMQESKTTHCSEIEPETGISCASAVDVSKPLPQPTEERNLPALPPSSESALDLFLEDHQSQYSTAGPGQFTFVPPIIAHSLSIPPTSSTQSLRSISIANLNKRSMVKQRLAQMKRENSDASVASSPLSPNNGRPLPSPRSPAENPSCMFRDSARTRLEATTEDSIIHSYTYSDRPGDNIFTSIPAIWSRPTVSPIAEDPRSDEESSSCRGLPSLHVDTTVETMYPPSGVDVELAINSQTYHDTADLIAAQEVHNSKQTVALNEIFHSIKNIDEQVSGAHLSVLTIDEKLDTLWNYINSNMKQASAQDKYAIQALQSLVSDNVITSIERLEKNLSQSVLESKTNTDVASNSDVLTQLTDVLALLREQNEKDTQRDLLHTDSVRYLNELNIWLETFVNGGTSQIQVLSDSLQQVLQTLGIAFNPDGSQAAGLLQDLQSLIHEGRCHSHNTAALLGSVNNLAEHLNAQSAQPLSVQGITGLIERQRQDHEGLMRTLTSELSNEIRGERLRFVEAMKEATAINVQAQVEEFKETLKREVRGMTKEVGRLHQEKQSMENQIADLFAFYSKQANNGVIMPGAIPAFDKALAQNRRGNVRTSQHSPEHRGRLRY
ncbi:hypothetical protein D9757_004252 [Collybiopsis confluens]|uniref:PH domain-containing protein n=1 Tax=Collybiopsis confluens TaxID=2823264 RepID=A0A8H5HTU2_9AGAR|nr:hypothetical protein D9757_004252 [Collybiopsis confluens]